MDYASLLETTAEIAVAFTGFIGIFVVLARRDGSFDPIAGLAIRVIVLSSVACVFYAALPVVLSATGLESDLLWRCSSAGLLAAQITWTAHIIRTRHRLEIRPPPLPLILNALTVAIVALNALGWPIGPSAGPYIVAVWLVLAVTAANFVIIIFDRVL